MAWVRLVAFLSLLLALLLTNLLYAQDVQQLQAGVVRITAKSSGGSPKAGTGFIVRIDKDAIYIVTAAHVVAGDPQPKVEFFTKRNVPVLAEVLGLEGDDEVRGLALLVVRGQENLPNGLTALPLAASVRLSGGEEIVVIGFPQSAGPWAVIKGNISSRQGRDIFFSPAVDSGHSGGPIIQSGKVVGLVSVMGQSSGRGITARSVHDYVEGFEITVQEHVAPRAAETQPEPTVPLEQETPAAVAKPSPSLTTPPERKRPAMAATAEVIGKDGAPMVLVPAGEFWMGQPDGEGEKDEHPRHKVVLDAFYVDRFEVTVARYAEFLRSTGRKGPRHWEKVSLDGYRDRPVIGVNWEDAQAYCQWAGKHLPTEAQWEKAAKGSDDRRIYPWGDDHPGTRHGNFGHCCEWKGYEILTDVNKHEEGRSPYGIYNMSGNVREWTGDWYEAEYYSKSPPSNPRGPESGAERVIRGGSWANSGEYLQATNRDREPPNFQSATIGIRCVQDSE